MTSGGCRALAGRVADHTSTIVQRWLDAGVVVFGKTSTPEFGSKGVTEPALFGPTRNPWDPRWTSRSGPDDPPDEFEHLWDFPDHLTDDGSWRRPRSSSVRSTAPAAPRDSA